MNTDKTNAVRFYLCTVLGITLRQPHNHDDCWRHYLRTPYRYDREGICEFPMKKLSHVSDVRQAASPLQTNQYRPLESASGFACVTRSRKNTSVPASAKVRFTSSWQSKSPVLPVDSHSLRLHRPLFFSVDRGASG